MLPEAVLLMLGPATLLAQISVNLIRMAFPDPDGGTRLNHWVSPALAVLFGILFSFLLMVIAEITISPSNLATAVVAGFLAGASAMGITDATRRASNPKVVEVVVERDARGVTETIRRAT